MVKKVRLAGFWIRAIADVLDSLLLDFAACLMVLMGLGAVYWGSAIEGFDAFALQFVLVGVRGFLALGYFSWSTYRYGTTVGKKALGVYVVSVEGYSPLTLKQSIIRCFSYLASYLPFGAGFLMVVFQPEKRALHDLIAGTVSIVRKKE